MGAKAPIIAMFVINRGERNIVSVFKPQICPPLASVFIGQFEEALTGKNYFVELTMATALESDRFDFFFDEAAVADPLNGIISLPGTGNYMFRLYVAAAYTEDPVLLREPIYRELSTVPILDVSKTP
jgi:hypothetical protein